MGWWYILRPVLIGLVPDVVTTCWGWCKGKLPTKTNETRDPETTVPPGADPPITLRPEDDGTLIKLDGKWYRRRSRVFPDGTGPTPVVLVAFLVALASGCSLVQTESNAKWLSGVVAGVKCPAVVPCEPCPAVIPCTPCPACPPAVVTPPGPVVPPETGYVVTQGQRVERRLRVPCWVEYRITGKQPSVEAGVTDNCTILWAYRPGEDWQTAGVVVRDYKIKSPQGERRYGMVWNSAQTYTVRLEIEEGRARLLIDGVQVAAIDASFEATATVGYGWPPSQRPGPEGAVISDVRWSEQ